MTQTLKNRAENLEGPAQDGFPVTPDDDALLVQPTRALYVGVDGDLAVEMLCGAQLVFEAVAGGTLLPLRVRKVMAATTAGAVVALL